MKRLYGALGLGSIAAALFAVVLLGMLVVAFFLPDYLFQRGIRSAVGVLTEGEASFDRVRLSEDGATIHGLAIHHGGRRLAYVDRVELFCDPAVFATMRWDIARAELHAVELDVAEVGTGITLPPRTWALLWSPEEGLLPRTKVDRLEIHGLTFTGEGRGGVVEGSSLWAAADHVLLDATLPAPLSFQAGELRSLEARWDGRRLGEIERLVLDPEGRLSATAVTAATGVQANGLPVWPPLLVQGIPDWAGGRAKTDPQAATQDWLGLDASWWPWQPQEASITGSLVVSDGKVAIRPMVWNLTQVQASAGPVQGGSIPWSVRTSTLGGTLQASGRLQRDGHVTGVLRAADLEARQLDPYLALNLDALGVRIREGTLSADLDLTLARSWLTLAGTATLYKVRFDRSSNLVSGISKGVLTSASWLLGGQDKSFSTAVNVRGDFRSNEFSPLRQLFGQVGAGIVKDAGNRVGKGVRATTRGVGAALGKIFGRKDDAGDEDGSTE